MIRLLASLPIVMVSLGGICFLTKWNLGLLTYYVFPVMFAQCDAAADATLTGTCQKLEPINRKVHFMLCWPHAYVSRTVVWTWMGLSHHIEQISLSWFEAYLNVLVLPGLGRRRRRVALLFFLAGCFSRLLGGGGGLFSCVAGFVAAVKESGNDAASCKKLEYN